MMSRPLTLTLFVVCLGLISAAEPLAAEQSPPSPTDPVDHAKDNAKKDKMVCKRIKVTGSHMKRRVCQKRSVWQAQQKAAQEEHRQMINKPATNAPG